MIEEMSKRFYSTEDGQSSGDTCKQCDPGYYNDKERKHNAKRVRHVASFQRFRPHPTFRNSCLECAPGMFGAGAGYCSVCFQGDLGHQMDRVFNLFLENSPNTSAKMHALIAQKGFLSQMLSPAHAANVVQECIVIKSVRPNANPVPLVSSRTNLVRNYARNAQPDSLSLLKMHV